LNSFSIDVREADVEITKEVGIISIDRLEITKTENYHGNISEIYFEAITNRLSSNIYERNKIDIRNQLLAVDTKHESSCNRHNFEKWIIVGAISSLAIIFAAWKIKSAIVSKRLRSTIFKEIAELRSSMVVAKKNDQQESLSMQNLSSRDDYSVKESQDKGVSPV
jgi:hypothetical protein